MSTTSDMDNQGTNDRQYGASYHSYVLRMWKTAEDTFKGYLLDPITNETYPLGDIPQAGTRHPFIQNGSKGVWLEPLGCWLVVWNPENE